jgi:hypothetical protein
MNKNSIMILVLVWFILVLSLGFFLWKSQEKIISTNKILSGEMKWGNLNWTANVINSVKINRLEIILNTYLSIDSYEAYEKSLTIASFSEYILVAQKMISEKKNISSFSYSKVFKKLPLYLEYTFQNMKIHHPDDWKMYSSNNDFFDFFVNEVLKWKVLWKDMDISEIIAWNMSYCDSNIFSQGDKNTHNICKNQIYFYSSKNKNDCDRIIDEKWWDWKDLCIYYHK